jgi:hypothetical protein
MEFVDRDRGLREMKPEVIYRHTERRSSFFWLLLALFLGGSPLAVYFTTPDAGPATLLLAIGFGLPLFCMSLMDLGKSNGVILNPRTRQLKFVEGFFSRRKTRVYSYDDIREVHLTRNLHRDTDWCLRTGLDQGQTIVLEGWSYDEAAVLARYLGAVFAMIPRVNGEPLPAQTVDVPSWMTNNSAD